MLVTELGDERCLICDSEVCLGLKEEPTGWKVYRVCLDGEESCRDRRVGTVSRGSVDHYDEVVERASQLVKQR